MRSCPASPSAKAGRRLPPPAAAAAARSRADGELGARGGDAVVGHRASRTAASGRSRALSGVVLSRVALPRVVLSGVALPTVALPGVTDRWPVWRVAVHPR